MGEDWQTMRMVSPLEFQLLVSALGMSKAGCARYLGISQSTVARYLRGKASVPAASVLLLRALLESGTRPLVPKRERRR
jgi:predicted transcriptional regulator